MKNNKYKLLRRDCVVSHVASLMKDWNSLECECRMENGT